MWNNSSSPAVIDQISCYLSYQSMTMVDIQTLYEVSIATSVVNSLTMILALVANGLVLAAVWSSRALHSPSNILVCCLALTDLLSALITQPLFILSHIARIQGYQELYCFTTMGFSISVAILSIVSFLTFTAVSVNRFLVLHLHLRYTELVTNRRVIFIAVCCWILCILEVSLTIPQGLYKTHFEVLIVFLCVGVFITLSAYTRIFHVIRKYERQFHEEQKLSFRLSEFADKAESKPANDVLKQGNVSRTMAFISALFLLCYIPYIAVLAANVVYIKQITSQVGLKIAGNVTLTIVLGNSSINPFLYLHRMREIRKAVLGILTKWRCWKPNISSTDRLEFTERKESFYSSHNSIKSKRLCSKNTSIRLVPNTAT